MDDQEKDHDVLEDEVTFEEDSSDWEQEFGDVDAYVKAFSTLLREGVHENHLALLRAHYAAPDQTTTWEALAKAVGYARGAAVNMQYGTFAKRVANAMGIYEAPRNFWLYVLVGWGPGLDPETGHTTFFLRWPVIEALQRLRILPEDSEGLALDPETGLRQLVPSEHWSDVLDAVAKSVELAHWANPAGWGLALGADQFVLTVGRYEVLRIAAGETPFAMVLDQGSVPAAAEELDDVDFSLDRDGEGSGEGSGYYAAAPGSEVAKFPFRRVGRAYAGLVRAHTAFVAEYGRDQLDGAVQDAHQPGLVDLVAEEVGRPLPQPTYVAR